MESFFFNSAKEYSNIEMLNKENTEFHLKFIFSHFNDFHIHNYLESKITVASGNAKADQVITTFNLKSIFFEICNY